MIAPPKGRYWWLAYDDGCVWPCEVLRPGLLHYWFVRPVAPAPDAGDERLEPVGRIYDAAFNRPQVTA